jgi:hypothetical protein
MAEGEEQDTGYQSDTEDEEIEGKKSHRKSQLSEGSPILKVDESGYQSDDESAKRAEAPIAFRSHDTGTGPVSSKSLTGLHESGQSLQERSSSSNVEGELLAETYQVQRRLLSSSQQRNQDIFLYQRSKEGVFPSHPNNHNTDSFYCASSIAA